MADNKTFNNTEALEAYKSLKGPGDIVKDEVILKLESFCHYLEELCKQISKPPKQNFIYNWIFCNDVEDKDVHNYCKANIFAATESLKRIVNIAKEQEISPIFKRLLIDYVCDLKEFINYFDSSHNYKWLVGNTFTHISNFYYGLAKNVFYYGKPGDHEQEYLTLCSSTPFIIRQSIEYKIKRILGINYIEINDKPHKTPADIYFKALNNNADYYITKKTNFEILEKIHCWTHLYIHGGYRARPWITETALFFLDPLFYAGTTTDSKTKSLYAGVEIIESDLTKLLIQTEEFVKKVIGEEVEIIWLKKPEAAYLKNDNN